MNRILFSVSLIFLIGINLLSQQAYQNKNLSPNDRAKDLIKHLTLEEKVGLIKNSSKAVPHLGVKEYDWWNEALHGVARNGYATVYPQAIGMAASFNADLLYEVFTSISDEARVKHRIARESGEMKRYQGLTMWTPNINIFRDPRWGRGQETYGEDPYLTSIMGVSVIKGLQGETTDGVDKLHACAKHYAVHNGPEWNRHSFDAKNITQRDLWETYLPAFEAAVKKGNVKEVMCAYNRFEGEPCCGSDQLLMQILREQWGYQGIVLSDCGAIRNFYMKDRHGTHADSKAATADAIISGTDLNCGSTYGAVKDAIEAGLLTEDQLDVALVRIFTARFELGEMDGTSPWDALPDSTVNCQKHKNLALQMAHESMVLLKNNGILPISSPKKILVLGENANDENMQWGNYHGDAYETSTLYEALTKALPNTEIVYEKVSSLTGDIESLFSECSVEGKKGFMAMYWDNLDMKGEIVADTIYTKAIKIGKRDVFATGMSLSGISGQYKSILTPKETGGIEIVFITDSKVEVTINGKPVKLSKKLPAIQYAQINVEKDKKYEIIVNQFHKEKGQFRFDIIRFLEPGIENVLKMAKNADIVIYGGGLSASLEREESNVYAPGFKGGDRTDIELPKVQRDVIAALKENGKKVILVNFSGSAMALVPESKNCDAILQAWYPGEDGGTAITDVLLGKYNPSGSLPITFYKNVEQLPDFEDYNMAGHTYKFLKEEPLYAFGYGLSYSSFKYGKAKLSKNSIKTGEKVTLTVPVSNTSKIDGDKIIQVYIVKEGDKEGPTKALCSFKKISISGENTVNVTFDLQPENLKWWNEKTQKMEMHPGNYKIMVGGSSLDKDLVKLTLVVK